MCTCSRSSSRCLPPRLPLLALPASHHRRLPALPALPVLPAGFLDRIKQAYLRDPALPNLLVDPDFAKDLGERWVCCCCCCRRCCCHRRRCCCCCCRCLSYRCCGQSAWKRRCSAGRGLGSSGGGGGSVSAAWLRVAHSTARWPARRLPLPSPCRASPWPLPDRRQAAWRRVVQLAVGAGIAVPGITSSLSYFDTYRRGRLPANLVQASGPRDAAGGPALPAEGRRRFGARHALLPCQHAGSVDPLLPLRRRARLACPPRADPLPRCCPLQAQRDFFGSHTYERTDGKEGWFHTGEAFFASIPCSFDCCPLGSGLAAHLFVASGLAVGCPAGAALAAASLTPLPLPVCACAVWDPTFGSSDSITTTGYDA